MGAIDDVRLDEGGPPMTERRDVIFGLFTSWDAMAARGFSFPEDRLALALMNHPRVRSVLVCDFRNGLRRVARGVPGYERMPFPASPTAAHYAPVRLRARDPLNASAVRRSYAAHEQSIRRVAARHGLVRPAVITANPALAAYGDFDWAGPVTYYAWDDWTAYEPHRRWWGVYQDVMQQVQRRGRRVVAVTDTILNRIRPTGPSAVVSNGIDASEWARLPPPPAWFAARRSPRLLYLGTLQSRIDVQQLQALAAALPEASITLVGPVIGAQHFAPLVGSSNIHIHRPISRAEVPGLIAHADAGLIPHIRSALTEAMSPLKLYEYLAAGVPVASVDLPGTRGISDRVALVPTGGSLLPAVQRALAMGRQEEKERLAFVSTHCWEQRFEALLDIALPESPE